VQQIYDFLGGCAGVWAISLLASHCWIPAGAGKPGKDNCSASSRLNRDEALQLKNKLIPSIYQ
jgi:hypothetical protein